MANREQLSILRQGVDVWNKWRKENQEIRIDLNGAILKGSKLDFADFSNADLRWAVFSEASLWRANFQKANLTEAKLNKTNLTDAFLGKANLTKAYLKDADLRGAFFQESNLTKAHLEGADLREATLIFANLKHANLAYARLNNAKFEGANLRSADLAKADLSEAVLSRAALIKASLEGANLYLTDLENADLTGANLSFSALVKTDITSARISKSNVYGVNVWDLEGEFAEQNDLTITPEYQSMITVDNIKIAQFIYLILSNKEIREVINILTSKAVLILGRFAIPERKAILDALKDKLREFDFLPIVFDFDRPVDKDFTETIKTLAGLSYFVIADITNPKSSPLELQATVPDYQIPFVPIIQEGESPFAMMVDLQKKYPWVLPTRSYDSIEILMSALKPGIIDPAVEMRNKLRLVKAQEQVTESLRDYVDKTL